MKNLTKRIFALLLVALMVLPMIAPAPVTAASVSKTYKIGVGYSGSVKDVAPLTQSTYGSSSDNNWYLDSYSFSINSSANYYGKSYIKATTYVGDYLVFRIQKPGAGTRSVSLNYYTFFRGGEGSVYILDKDADVQSSLVPENRIGKVSFYNEETTPDTDVYTEELTTSVLGSWEFGDADEYLLVLECSAASPIHPEMGYMYPVSVTITEEALTPTEIAQKAHSMVISEKPIDTFEIATYAATGMINGQPHIYVPVEGKKVFIYNLETGEKYDEIDTRFTVCRGMTVDADNKLWMVGSQYYLQCYDPTTKTISYERSTQGNMNSGFDLIYVNETGCLYFGSSDDAHIYQFKISTSTLTDLGNFNEDTAYACGLAYDNGYLYAGIVGNKNSDATHTREVVKIDLETGKCVARADVSDCVNKKEIMIRGAAISNGIYLAGGNEMDYMLALDTNHVDVEGSEEGTMNQVELTYNGTVITNPINFSVSESLNGKHYFSLKPGDWNYVSTDGKSGTKGSVEPGLYTIDDATGEIAFVSDGLRNSLKMGQDSIISVNGADCIFWQGGDHFRYMNLSTCEITELNTLISNNDSAPVSMNSIAVGISGRNEILLGAFNNDKCTVFNTESGILSDNFYTNGQTDCMITYNNQLYVGNYKDGTLVQVDMENSEKNKVLIDFRYTKDDNGEYFSQVRVHCLAAGDGKIFAGTMPDSYLRGGCIGWYDTKTGESHIVRNVVENQSINSLVYHDGYLYGTTTIAGGTGSKTDSSLGLSAKMFIYDVDNPNNLPEEERTVIIDLKTYISGLPGTLSYIGGIVADPDIANNGKIWGVVCETLFSYDISTGKVTEEMSLSKTKYAGNGSTAKDICFLDGYIYIYFKGSNLFAKINYDNPSQNVSYLPITAPSHYVIGEDQNLYYINDDTFYMYPLNVTDDDKAAASDVDALISQLPEPNAADFQAKVEAARAAYDALSWDQRALVMKLYLLEEAQTDLLEVRIAGLDPENPDQETVNELQESYDGMSKKLKSYVSNYSKLSEAQALLKPYAIGDTVYDTLNAALEAASEGTVIKLLKNYEEADVVLTKGAILDLNGYTLVCDSFDSFVFGDGTLIDSAAGEGLLQTETLLLQENNTHMPLMDRAAKGYRLFAYTYSVDGTPEDAGTGAKKFYYQMKFESDAAYKLIIASRTGLEIGADLYFDDEFLVRALFGGEWMNVNTFCVNWAEFMQTAKNPCLYVRVSGLNAFALDGTLVVDPLVSANGVKACPTDGSAGTVTYECNGLDFGYAPRT